MSTTDALGNAGVRWLGALGVALLAVGCGTTTSEDDRPNDVDGAAGRESDGASADGGARDGTTNDATVQHAATADARADDAADATMDDATTNDATVSDGASGDGASDAGESPDTLPPPDAACPVSCDDGDVCTDDACGATGCVHVPVSGSSCLDTAADVHIVLPSEDDCSATYSPTVIADPSGTFFHMWAGGWRNCAEAADHGTDKMFHARSTGLDLSSWTWDSAAVLNDPVRHYNDPTVIVVANPAQNTGHDWLFLMYMTTCTDDCFTPGHNVTYGATSYDGVSWSTPTPVIGIDNGYDQGGAWAPSAVVIHPSLVYLYFHDNTATGPTLDPPRVLRAAINPAADFFHAEPAELTNIVGTNVDVIRTASGAWELTSTLDCPVRITRYYSTDGLTFTPDPWFPGISGQPSYAAFSSHTFPVDATSYWMFFGWGPRGQTADTTCAAVPVSIQGWHFARAREH